MCPTLKTEAREEVHGNNSVQESSIVLHLHHLSVLKIFSCNRERELAGWGETMNSLTSTEHVEQGSPGAPGELVPQGVV